MTDTSFIQLWDGSVGDETRLVDRVDPSSVIARNVTRPTLTPFIPVEVTDPGTAVVICPGGGFHFLSIISEGAAVAEWFNAHGITAYVLEYRTCPTPVDQAQFVTTMMQAMGGQTSVLDLLDRYADDAAADGREAVRWVRRQFDRVILIGFSAGARVSLDVSLSESRSDRPDAAVVVYLPAVHPSSAAAAPPLFLLAAEDDQFGTQGSVDLRAMWKAAGRPVELHLFEGGGHGFGMKSTGTAVDGWIELVGRWLTAHGLLAPGAAGAAAVG